MKVNDKNAVTTTSPISHPLFFFFVVCFLLLVGSPVERPRKGVNDSASTAFLWCVRSKQQRRIVKP
jgi:hypothetical protein